MSLDTLLVGLLYLMTGFLIGWGFGLTGIGAGVLVVPALIHFFGISPVYAVGTGLAFSTLARTGGALYHLRLKSVRMRRSLYFLMGSAPAVLLASSAVNVLGKKYGLDRIERYIKICTGIIAVVSALAVIFQLITQDRQRRQIQIARSRILSLSLSKKLLAVFLGLVIGSLIGVTSVGGGVLMIPILMLFLDASAQQAVGTSIFISFFLALLGGLVYLSYGHVKAIPTILLALGAWPGVRFGTRHIRRLSEPLLTIIVAGIALLGGIGMFF